MNLADLIAERTGYPKKNILHSLLWLSGIAFPAGCAAITFGPWPGSLLPFGVACLPVIATLWYYRHWSKEDPDRLQTEDYRIQKEVVAKIDAYVDGKPITIAPGQQRLTANVATDDTGGEK